MKALLLPLLVALIATDAEAAMAFLVSQHPGQSVTGQPIMVCTYVYQGRQFERAVPAGGLCPSNIEVQ